ncbi:hypothetical protein LQW54_012839 [Pestalotiopsis sp. IQ-011]
MSSTNSPFSGHCPPKSPHAFSSMSTDSSSDLSSQRVDCYCQSSAATGVIVSSTTNSSTTSPQQAQQNMADQIGGIMESFTKK